MNQERINAMLHKLDTGWTKPIATPPEFAEAAEVIRYLQSDRNQWMEDAKTYHKEMERRGGAIVELQTELEKVKNEAEKDYADMRRFQAKFITADHALMAIKNAPTEVWAWGSFARGGVSVAEPPVGDGKDWVQLIRRPE